MNFGGPESQLLFRIRQGDQDAEREVFHRYLTRLVALARSRMSEALAAKFDADDVVQSAFRSFFVRVRKGDLGMQRGRDLWSLLASITRHKVLKKAEHYRQQKRDVDRDRPLWSEGCLARGAEPTAEEAIELTDEVTFLMRALAPRQRTILQMRLQGRSIPEIADAVERSERTVRRFLIRFRVELEQRLRELRQL